MMLVSCAMAAIAKFQRCWLTAMLYARCDCWQDTIAQDTTKHSAASAETYCVAPLQGSVGPKSLTSAVATVNDTVAGELR
jgi:hypothetical protein